MKCLCEQLDCKYVVTAPLNTKDDKSKRSCYCYRMPIPKDHSIKIKHPYATHFDVFLNSTVDIVKCHFGDNPMNFNTFPGVKELFYKKCPNIKMLKQIAAVEKL